MTENSETIRGQMEKFWKDCTKMDGTIAMMLDTKANEICDIERDEILAMIPDCSGKDVLELGAGIGRFTGELGEKAKTVIAVDFMDDFLKHNKVVNSCHANVAFLSKNVMDIEIEDNSVDVIFSNQLLMYLSDTDIGILVPRMMKWLRPGGSLLFCESCHKPCDDAVLSHNPTIYRNPSQYTNLITLPERTKTDEKVYGFDVVFSKPVQVYIAARNYPNQMCWLLELCERDHAENDGHTTFQKYLDQGQYTHHGILLLQQGFGIDYLSPGGHEAAKKFSAMLDIKQGDKVLDVGCGIGGSAFHVAKEYGAHVIGIDLSENMIEMAKELQAKYQASNVTFEVTDARKVYYPENSFDVIYSRDVILHIPQKDLLFQSFYKWLKPGGRILITDYVCGPRENHSEKFKEYIRRWGYKLLTVAEYGQMLKAAGFRNTTAKDNIEYFRYTLRKERDAFESKKAEFFKTFSMDDYNFIADNWDAKLERTAKGDQTWGMFYATKED